MTFHLDRGSILSHEFTPEGYLNCYMRIARTGDLKYFNADGSERIEVVTPEVLFSKASTKSFKAKPVTLLHPPEKVDSKNARTYQRGLTSPYITIDGDFLGIVATITDEETINEIVSGRAVEVSCGYDAATELRSDGKYYQTSRIGNHVAVVPKGRAGSEVRIKLDSADTLWQSEVIDTASDLNLTLIQDSFDTLKAKSIKKIMKKFKLDGFEFETEDIDLAKHAKGVDTELTKLRLENSVLSPAHKDSLTEIETLKSQVATLETEKDSLKARHDALETFNGELKTKLEDAEKKAEIKLDADQIAAEIQARMDAWSDVAEYLKTIDKDFKVDAKMSAMEIKKLALSKRFPKRSLEGKSEAYIDGLYDSVEWSEESDKADSEDTAKTVDSVLESVAEGRKDAADNSTKGLSFYMDAYKHDLENAWQLK